VTPFLEERFTVVALDRRGRGASTDTEPYAVEREAEDVAAVAEWAGGPATVMGHSYGAICALEAALRTAAIARLVLYEPPVPVGLELVSPTVRAEVASLIERGLLEEALLVFFRKVVRLPEGQIEVLRAHPAWSARVAAADTLGREMAIEAGYRPDPDRLRTLTTPTTLLLGSDSPAALKEATARVHALLPRSVVVEMAGQQHVAMDMIPEEFAHLVAGAAAP
jgi:pimeloyl-ACP methyl ester carboxylesterase